MPLPKEATEEIEFYSERLLEPSVVEVMMFNADAEGNRRRRVYQFKAAADKGPGYIEKWTRDNRKNVLSVDARKPLIWMFRLFAGLKVKILV
ncbi:hypothetical protein R50073_40780 [Maricurvus nonylphenolicus]